MGYPFGLTYAEGPYRIEHAVPSSAFSKGDILQFTSASSISRANPVTMTALAGVALAASTQSYRNLVPYLVADNETVFWSRASTVKSQYTEGERLDFEYTSAIWMVSNSRNTRSAIIYKGSAADAAQWNTDNSAISYVLVRLASSRTEDLAVYA